MSSRTLFQEHESPQGPTFYQRLRSQGMRTEHLLSAQKAWFAVCSQHALSTDCRSWLYHVADRSQVLSKKTQSLERDTNIPAAFFLHPRPRFSWCGLTWHSMAREFSSLALSPSRQWERLTPTGALW